LKLYGKGISFESLVNRFLPGATVSEVIDYARVTTEISLLPRKRIALIGSVLVNTSTARNTLLAHAVRHIDLLLSTLGHNATLAPEERLDRGRMERMVLGVIRKDQYPDFMRALRPQIYELLLQFDGAVEQRAPTAEADIAESTAVAIGVYVAEDADWNRTGVNPLAAIPPSR
jgi:hypothetical protein